MKITMQNYEEYFVRFIDHELSKEEVGEVQLFLQHHPELKTELEAFRSTILTPDDSFVFSGKESLRRGISLSNYEEYFLRHIEHDLSVEGLKEVNIFLQKHPQLQSEFNVFKQTVLVPDASIVYPNKRSLKKRVGDLVVPLYVRYMVTAAAAAGLFLILFVKEIGWNNNDDPTSIAKQELVKPETIDTPSENNSPADQQSANQQAASTQTLPNTLNQSPKQKKNQGLAPETSEEAPLLFAGNMEPMSLPESDGLPYYRKVSRAYYLGPDAEQYQSSPVRTVNRSSGTTWTSMASVVGSEILKLSGRGDLLKASRDTTNQPKLQGPVELSIQSEKFAFYHKFFKKKKSSSTSKNN